MVWIPHRGTLRRILDPGVDTVLRKGDWLPAGDQAKRTLLSKSVRKGGLICRDKNRDTCRGHGRGLKMEMFI